MTTTIEETQDEVLQALLQPLSEADPCGPAMRYDPVFTEIRLAREEDDPTLPMRQWERPLKKADWPLIESLCTRTLTTRTKDLQLAAWLVEAWTRQEGLRGFVRGLQLVRELLETFWEPLHPRIEDGDADARVASLEWLNETLSTGIKVHVTMLPLVDRKPSRVTLADWERLSLSELSTPQDQPSKPGPRSANAAKSGARPSNDEADAPPLTRSEVIVNVRGHSLDAVRTQLQEVREATALISKLSEWLDSRLGMDAPNLGKLKGVLLAMERALLHLAPAPEPSKDQAMPVLIDKFDPLVSQPQKDELMDRLDTPADSDAGSAEPSPLPAQIFGWRSREEAYQTLHALAEYLGRIEPHSPTPYLIRRAVRWGRMPLPELMAEFMEDGGDLDRMFKLVTGTGIS